MSIRPQHEILAGESTLPYMRIVTVRENDLESEEDNGDHPESKRNERQPSVKVYKRRFYVLMLFCMLNTMQGWMQSTWGPVSDSAILVFGWSGAQIGLFSILNNLSYSLTVFFTSYIMDVYGLRVATLGMCIMMVLGTAIRCITSQESVLFWLSVISALMSGIAGPVTFGGPALFASVWFPASQRATANAFVNTFQFIGVSVAFLVGPAIVHYVKPSNVSNVENPFSRLPAEHVEKSTSNISLSATLFSNNTIAEQREQIMYYLYVEAGIAAFLFLLVLIYFPAKPPLPPSISASTSRLHFRSGLWKLTKSRSFWLIALAYSIPAGVFSVWANVLNVNLQPVGVSQDTAGRLGVYYNIAGAVAGLGVSRVADLFSGHMKVTLVILYVMASGALCWISLICHAIIPFNTASLFIAAILASIFVNSGVALFYELTCEICYPVAEGIIGGYLTLLNCVTGIIFLSVLYIPKIGTSWMTWTMFGCTVVGIPLMLFVKERYARLELDSGGTIHNEDTTTPDIIPES